MRKLIGTIAVVALLGGLAALGAGVASGDGVSAASTKTVTIADDTFTPHKFSISKGAIVKWVWSSDNVDMHQVAQADRHFDPKSGGFQSKEQSTGSPFRHRFRKAGTFYVICLVHPDVMRMKIVVRR